MNCPVGGSRHPSPTTEGAACDRCVQDCQDALDYLAACLPLLRLDPPHNGTVGARSVPASRPPVRVEALSYLAQGGLVATLGRWVHTVATAGRVTLPDYHLATGAKLRAYLTVLSAHQRWLLDTPEHAKAYVLDVTTAATDLAHLLDPDHDWVPLPGRWTCPVVDPDGDGTACGGLLRQHKGRWLVRCPTCRSTWEGDQGLEHLGLLLGCDPYVTVAQAAVIASVTERTIYLWVQAGTLPTTGAGRRITIDRKDLALLLAGRSGP